jgi:hypothetical protein
MIRSPILQCGKPYATEAEALRSKAARNPGVLVELCWAGGHFHIATPPCITGSRTGEFPAAESPVSAGTKNAPRRTSSSGKLTPPEPSEFSPKVKLLVRKRAGRGDIFEAQCEACPQWLGKHYGEFQHRAARGAGGCKDAVINGPANCALMCPPCHRRAESRDPAMGSDLHLAEDAAGFWIKHGTEPEFDPRSVPILLMSPGGSGLPVYLAADGLGPDGTGYLLQRPELAAAS